MSHCFFLNKQVQSCFERLFQYILSMVELKQKLTVMDPVFDSLVTVSTCVSAKATGHESVFVFAPYNKTISSLQKKLLTSVCSPF